MKCKRGAGEEEDGYFEVGKLEEKRNELRWADVMLRGSEPAKGGSR